MVYDNNNLGRPGDGSIEPAESYQYGGYFVQQEEQTRAANVALMSQSTQPTMPTRTYFLVFIYASANLNQIMLLLTIKIGRKNGTGRRSGHSRQLLKSTTMVYLSHQ